MMKMFKVSKLTVGRNELFENERKIKGKFIRKKGALGDRDQLYCVRIRFIVNYNEIKRR